GLPKTVDPLFLERQLLLGGHATIAQPKKGSKKGFWYSAKAVQTGPLGVYDYPKSWQAYNRDQLRFNATGKNGVWIYDNVMRFPLCAALDIFARELVDVQKTEQVNRFWQKLPFILVAPDDMDVSANNLLSQVMGGEPAIIANRYVKDMEPYRLGFDVPFLGRELNASEQNVLNKVYTILGIANLTFKSERMIEDEVHDMGEPSTLMALAALTERRRAAEYLNTRFGMNVSVVWRTDYQSENFNLLESIEKSAKILTGNTKGLAEVMQSE
ncbi:MAG: hypothetical protein IKF14_12500, partial [Atopobiaceae bacterium]|nr:hypothetical protein [Atopobiaceae bacterium]